MEMEVRIRQLGEIRVARIRHVGPYDKIGPCFMQLFDWIGETGARPGRVFSLSHDNPETVAPDQLRSDACVEIDTDAASAGNIVIDTVKAGTCAVYTHKGPYDGIRDAYGRLFGQWFPQSGEVPDGGPCLEIYLNSPFDTAPGDLLTELCIPLRRQQDT